MRKRKKARILWSKRFLPLILVLCFLCWTQTSGAQETLATTTTLEKLVSQWVELKRQIALEKESWQEDRCQLQNERTLLRQEKKLLQKELKQVNSDSLAKNAQRLQLLKKKQQDQAALAACEPALRQVEAALQQWEKRLPASLLHPLIKHFNKLRNTSEKSVSQRLQIILALYAQIESYQCNINVGKQVIARDEQHSLEFDVLYLGLAQGFCVSQDGKYAGIGTLEVTGWEWQWRPELAVRIQQCLNLQAREKIAEFVPLPVRIKKDAL